MIIAIAAMIVGLVVLVVSADVFVAGAVALARALGMSAMLVGVVVVGFGTSLPEIVVSLLAVVEGNAGLALGNAYGSNISNIALILGATAIISPVLIPKAALKRELLLLMMVSVLAAWQIADGWLSRFDALGLFLAFALAMGISLYFGEKPEIEAEFESSLSLKQALLRVVGGLIVLIVASRLLVWGAVSIAQQFGVSDLVIGLTVVAVGTSLPELAASISAARKGETDLVVGNVLGSNLFNTALVVGISAVLQPFAVEKVVLSRDMTVMLALTASLFVLGGRKGRERCLGRAEGALLVGAFGAYTAFLIYSA